MNYERVSKGDRKAGNVLFQDIGPTQVLARHQAAGGRGKPVSAGLVEGQWGRLDRLVDVSRTPRV